MNKTCKKHNCKMYRRYNSTIWVCPKCLNEQNKEKLKKAFNSKIDNNTKKRNSQKFNLYITTAWKYFSHYVLLFYANDDLIVRCATSNKPLLITNRNCHCGHFIKVRDGSKSNYATAFLFHNVAPQSLQENTYHGGRPEVMKEWLIKKHGREKIEELEIIKHNICKPDAIWLKYLGNYWKKKYKELLLSRNISDPWK